MALIVIIMLILPAILYYVIRDAVQEGVYRALTEYDNLKEERQKEL